MTKQTFTQEEVEAEALRRADPKNGSDADEFECVHCHSTFPLGSGGNISVPICNLCLHND